VIIRKKTGRPVQFEITENTRRSITALSGESIPCPEEYHFQSRLETSPHRSTRQYVRTVQG
jgi:hypothetical protein